MKKKMALLVLILVLGCGAAVLFSGCSKEKTDDIIPEEEMEMLVNARICAGDERSREEIEKEIRNDVEDNEKREKEDYEKAKKAGIEVTDEEIDEAIQETKEAIKGTNAEEQIETYCKDKGITIDEYWKSRELRELYRKNHMILKYRSGLKGDIGDLTKILTPESLLVNYEEKEEIEALAEEILAMAKCFEEYGFHAEISDIDFLKAYCTFVEAGVLAEQPETKTELERLLASAKKVWNIPVHFKGEADGKAVTVQVSRALELSEINQEGLTEEELERAKKRAGKWTVVSSQMNDNGVMPEQMVGEILSANNKDIKKCQCVLLGGEPGIRTLTAVIVENDMISGIISLGRDVRDGNDIVLERNRIYSFDTFTKIISQYAKESPLAERGKGGAVEEISMRCIYEAPIIFSEVEKRQSFEINNL